LGIHEYPASVTPPCKQCAPRPLITRTGAPAQVWVIHVASAGSRLGGPSPCPATRPWKVRGSRHAVPTRLSDPRLPLTPPKCTGCLGHWTHSLYSAPAGSGGQVPCSSGRRSPVVTRGGRRVLAGSRRALLSVPQPCHSLGASPASSGWGEGSPHRVRLPPHTGADTAGVLPVIALACQLRECAATMRLHSEVWRPEDPPKGGSPATTSFNVHRTSVLGDQSVALLPTTVRPYWGAHPRGEAASLTRVHLGPLQPPAAYGPWVGCRTSVLIGLPGWSAPYCPPLARVSVPLPMPERGKKKRVNTLSIWCLNSRRSPLD